jgi:hypothetical protein
MIAAPPATVVTVTQEDIEQGCRGDVGHCPVARAIARALDRSDILVWGARVNLFYAPSSFYLPGHVTQWIVRFDHGEPVSPFSFEMGAEL